MDKIEQRVREIVEQDWDFDDEIIQRITTYIREAVPEEMHNEYPDDKDNRAFQLRRDGHNRCRTQMLKNLEKPCDPSS